MYEDDGTQDNLWSHPSKTIYDISIKGIFRHFFFKLFDFRNI